MSDKQQLKISDLQGLTKLIIDATVNITTIAEDLNHQIIHPPYLPSSPIQELISSVSSLVYNSIRETTKLLGKGIENSLSQIAPERSIGISFDQKETLISILNGIIGDYLEKEKNALAIPMEFKYQGKTVPLVSKAIQDIYPKPSGKILLLIHGLCMDDLQWSRNEHNHGELLSEAFDLSPIYLKYNSGLHISENGKNLSTLLEDFIQAWPVPVEEITIIAHSMGGLVTRSAYNYGTLDQKKWPQYLHKIIFLGAPHQGAPLERVGNHVDRLLEAIPYARPFAKLGKMRSAGITDLRLGILVQEDWENLDRFENEIKQATILPLPQKVACYAIAASMEATATDIPLTQLGDGLVPIKSALGLHKNAAQSLHFKPNNTWIVYQCNHFDLLDSLEVYQKMQAYLTL